ncbi:MAG: YicC/YloC family endoribonuclease [Phycisphaerales bacterium]
MTGYGESASNSDGVRAFLEVRSLNSRYFKTTIRLPEDLQGLEAEIEAVLRKRLVRGTVTLTARFADDATAAAHRINTQALASYMDQIREALGAPPSGFDAGLLALPGVLEPPADEEARIERARSVLLALLEKALTKLVDMRTREGADIRGDLQSHLDVIETRLTRLTERAPKAVQEYETRLRSRIDALLSEANLRVEPADLIREIAVYAERTDVAEELARLKGHLAQFGELISRKDGAPVGRTLDFLAQEMLREANTIASKCSDAEMSRDIVEVKGAIDRIKEQAQNVE